MKHDYFSGLSKEEKDILERKGTEAPFSGEYNDHFIPGIFICRACKSPLYEAKTKFDSGCGWPSFDDEIEGAIIRKIDNSDNRIRTEICCARCDGHLGHVFHGEKITKKNTRHCVNSLSIQFKKKKNLSEAIFGAGCFWSVQHFFQNIKGVYMCQAGYMGGHTKDPSYSDICKGDTNHAEVIQIYYEEDTISFEILLHHFWSIHDPTYLNRQGNDVGTQYRSVIFYVNNEQKKISEESLKKEQKNLTRKIVTQVLTRGVFYRAEEYHQNYLEKNNSSSCSI